MKRICSQLMIGFFSLTLFFTFTFVLTFFVIDSLSGKQLTDSLLVKTSWGPDFRDWGLHIKFYSNGKYKKEKLGPDGGAECAGRYVRRGNRVTLYAGSKSHDGSVKCRKRLCVFGPATGSLLNVFKLKCRRREIYWSQKPDLPAGAKRKFGRIHVRTMGHAKAKLTNAMKIRSLPSRRGRIYRCKIYGETAYSLPKESEVRVLARTTRKATIGKHENYWYYVDVGSDATCTRQRGWMFAEWVKLSEVKSKGNKKSR